MNKEEIISEAREWLGTKFKHQGRVKKHGCDCIGLIIGIAEKLEICSRKYPKCQISTFDKTNYGRLPNDLQLENSLNLHLVKTKKLKMGNIVLMKFNELPQHVGVIGNYDQNHLSLIHAYLPSGRVIEHVLDQNWQEKIIANYQFNLTK